MTDPDDLALALPHSVLIGGKFVFYADDLEAFAAAIRADQQTEIERLRGLLAETRAAMDETSPGMAHIELIDRVDAAFGENDD